MLPLEHGWGDADEMDGFWGQYTYLPVLLGIMLALLSEAVKYFGEALSGAARQRLIQVGK